MGLLLTFGPQFLNWENRKSGQPTFCSYPSSSLEKYKIPYLGISMRVSQMRLNAVKLVTLICRFIKLGLDSETPSWVRLNFSCHFFIDESPILVGLCVLEKNMPTNPQDSRKMHPMHICKPRISSLRCPQIIQDYSEKGS